MDAPLPTASRLARCVRDIADELADPDSWPAMDDDDEPDPAQHRLALAVATTEGDLATAGAAQERFPVQSISKVFALERVLEARGEKTWERVGREPSGDPFNSLIDLERTRGMPRNPFINAGALVVVDMLLDTPDGPDAVRNLVADMLDGECPPLDAEVARSHETGAHLNRAMLHLMRHFDNVCHSAEEVLEAYARQCAIRLDVGRLARTGLFLTHEPNGRPRPHHDADRARRILSLMMTSGPYDRAGEFAYRVGMPAKSGIAGGILAIVPHVAAVAVWSPRLDSAGNSVLGTMALERLAQRLDWSVFGRARAARPAAR